ncbi:hypothetical protein LXL04_034467 [Taraxacum kok-saghyz]
MSYKEKNEKLSSDLDLEQQTETDLPHERSREFGSDTNCRIPDLSSLRKVVDRQKNISNTSVPTEDEELDVRERRSKNKHDGGSRENVKNTRSSPRKVKDNKVVEERAKGKIFVRGKKVVVEFEKPSRKKRQPSDEDDDDFLDVPGPSRKQKGKGKEVKKAKKKVVKKPKAANEFPNKKNRCSPISKLMDVPMKMCYYVLERLDVEKLEVVVENGVLDVSAQSVHDMLGLPLGETSFKYMPAVDEDDEDSCIFEWKNQFENTKDLRLKQLKNDILLTRAGDLNFRINFLVMFINTFCESTSMDKCNLNALHHIKKDTDISSINWCEYVVECLVKTKRAYNPDKESSFSSVLLLILRFERMDIPRTRPAICFWSSEMIRVREDYEMLDGGFGFGEVNGKFVEEFIDISDDDEEDREYDKEVEEEEEEEVDSDDEMSEESFENSIKIMFERMEEILERLNDSVDKPIERYPENQSFKFWKFRISIADQFEFPIEHDHDEDTAMSTPAFGQDGEDNNEEEGDDDDDQVDGNDNDGIMGTMMTGTIITIMTKVVVMLVWWSLGMMRMKMKIQIAIQVTQVESLNMQSSELEDESEVVENEVEKEKEKKSDKNEVEEDENVVVEEKESEVVMEKEDENEGNVSRLVVESSNVGGEEKMSVIQSLSSPGSQEFWNSSAVEKLLLAATTQTSKAIEKSKEIEKSEGRKNLVESFPAPSFSLGLSQGSFQSSQPSASVDVKADVINTVSVSVIPFSDTKPGPSKPKANNKREKKPTLALKSPYKERMVDPRAALTQDQNAICEWLFNLKGNPIDVVKSPLRLFMKLEISFALENEHLDEEKKYQIFKENFSLAVYGDKDLVVLKDVDLVSIDNSADEAEFLDKYGKVFTPLAREYCQKTDANVRFGDRYKAKFEIASRLNAFGWLNRCL